jgi:hypothetical protein
VNSGEALEFLRQSRLESTEIIRFLRSFSNEHLLSYLEYLIQEKSNKEETVHEEYIKNLLEMLSERRPPEFSSDEELSDEDLSPEDPPNTIEGSLGRGIKNCQAYGSKLKDILISSSSYRAHEVLKLFPSNGLLEERIILYTKVGEIASALYLLIFQLGDYVRAQQYVFTCSSYAAMRKIGSLNETSPPSIHCRLVESTQSHYSTLVNICVESKIPQNELMCMIEKYMDYLDAELIIAAIDESIPLHKVVSIISRSFSGLSALSHNSSVECSMTKLTQSKAQIIRSQLQQGSVLLDDVTSCALCRKRIGIRYWTFLSISYK